ncbi:hypothetical protein EST38_g9248 [Candolleomyces aberdarensis]|uniref:Polynucleotide 5'-hydroxyl-kinase GRC3 n=1 Tax=Candolleomyces aberdarensis TaxID=2316362 RepID=A0A4Q2DB71_9AGAR|nr:hypothetical protein EST38_g9248 [Candolleomyces aberdarensis]
MISAVAARKAALAKAQAQARSDDGDVSMTATPEAGPSYSSYSSKRKSQSSSETEQKRTPSSSRNKKKPKTKRPEDLHEGDDEERLGGTSKRKRKDSKRVLKKNAKPASRPQRYFTTQQQDSFKQGEDVIALGSDAESDSVSLIVGLEGADDEDEDAVLSSESLSDEDDLMQIDGGLTLSTLFPHTQKPSQQQTISTPLSTFKPTLEETVFPLSEDELSKLGLGKIPPSTILLFPSHDTLCLLGTCSITVLHGSITMFGTTLHASPEPHRVFAPKSSPLPVIRCAFTSTKSSSSSLLPNLSLPSRIEVDEDLKRHGAVLLFSELRTGVEGLGRICRPFLNVFEPSKWQHCESGVIGIRGLSIVYDQLSDTHPFVLPPSWSDALDRAISANLPSTSNGVDETGNVYLAKGPKNAGKSTFAKTLVNRLLEVYTHVAYLDLDPGQPEFTPPGLISLSLLSKPVFGPPWTHPSVSTNQSSPITVKSLYLGCTTPKNEVELWLEGARALWECYREGVRFGSASASSYSKFGHEFEEGEEDGEGDGDDEDEDKDEEDGGEKRGVEGPRGRRRRIKTIIPLVINTMGWTKGLGADLTRKIEDEFGVVDIFAFSSPSHHQQDESEPVHHQRGHGFSAFQSTGYDEYSTGTIANGKRPRVYDLQPPIPSIPEGPGGRGGVGGGTWSGAADQRTMNLLSYFHSVFPSPPPTSPTPSSHTSPISLDIEWQTQKPLLAIRPYNLSLRQAGIKKIVLCGAGSEDVVMEEVGRVLCGGVVGLVVDDVDDGGNVDLDNEGEDMGDLIYWFRLYLLQFTVISAQGTPVMFPVLVWKLRVRGVVIWALAVLFDFENPLQFIPVD